MFWDAALDPLRDLVSGDILKWTVASILVAFFFGKLISLFSGSALEPKQELNVMLTLFLTLFFAFYLP